MPYLFQKANAVGHTHTIHARSAMASGNKIVLEKPIKVSCIFAEESFIPNFQLNFNHHFIHFQNVFGDIEGQLILPIVEGADDAAVELAIKHLPDEFTVRAALIKDHGLLVWGNSWDMVVKQ